jgi:hypothetical protein
MAPESRVRTIATGFLQSLQCHGISSLSYLLLKLKWKATKTRVPIVAKESMLGRLGQISERLSTQQLNCDDELAFPTASVASERNAATEPMQAAIEELRPAETNSLL